MNKMEAKLALSRELGRQSWADVRIACLENGEITATSPEADMWHLTFPVGAPLGEIQITVEFQDDWLEVLAFPHPCVIAQDHAWLEMLRFVNLLNDHIKLQRTNGRLCVDGSDVAYNARLSYEYLERMPGEAVNRGVLGFLSFVSDAAVPLYRIGQGEMTAAEGRRYLMELWGM